MSRLPISTQARAAFKELVGVGGGGGGGGGGNGRKTKVKFKTHYYICIEKRLSLQMARMEMDCNLKNGG